MVSTEPAGAMVVLDDQMERSPATFRDLKPGKHKLRIMLPDYDPVEMEVSLDPAQNWRSPVIKLVRSKGSAQLASRSAGSGF